MSTLRLISILRSSLLTTKCCRMFSQMSSIDFYARVPVRTQQICLFSSTSIVHAQRRDKIDANITEEFDDDEADDESGTDQVIQSFFIS